MNGMKRKMTKTRTLLKRGVLLFILSAFVVTQLAPLATASLDPSKERLRGIKVSDPPTPVEDDPFPDMHAYNPVGPSLFQ
jgi:hypothetical protein